MKFEILAHFQQAVAQGKVRDCPLFLFLLRDEEEAAILALETLKGVLPKRTVAEIVTLQLLQEWLAPSLFGEKRGYILESCEKLKKPLSTYLEKTFPWNGVICALTSSFLKSDHPLYRLAQEKGVIVDLTFEKPWEKEARFQKWVIGWAKEKKIACDAKTADVLLKRVGFDRPLLERELEKIWCFLGERQKMTEDDIRQVVVASKEESSWQFGNALLQRKGGEALYLGKAQLSQGVSLQGLLVQTRSQFQTAYKIASLSHLGASLQHIQKELPHLRPKMLETTLQTAVHYGLDALRLGLLAIFECDVALRSTQTNPELLMEKLVTILTRK